MAAAIFVRCSSTDRGHGITDIFERTLGISNYVIPVTISTTSAVPSTSSALPAMAPRSQDSGHRKQFSLTGLFVKREEQFQEKENTKTTEDSCSDCEQTNAVESSQSTVKGYLSKMLRRRDQNLSHRDLNVLAPTTL